MSGGGCPALANVSVALRALMKATIAVTIVLSPYRQASALTAASISDGTRD
jgi:hypothetical protein